MSKFRAVEIAIQISDFGIDHKIPLFWYCLNLSSLIHLLSNMT
jgi:hypothetical protein